MGPIEEVDWILRKNTPFSRRRELEFATEAAKVKVHAGALDILYKQVNSVRRIDFETIDKSKGDIKKLSFKADIDNAITMLGKVKGTESEVKIIIKSWSNLAGLSKKFEEGYKLGRDFVILTYECVVMSVIDAISTLITKTASKVVKSKENVSDVSIKVLGRFNSSVKDGTVGKMFKEGLKTEREVKEDFGLTGTAAILLLGVAAMALIPIIREAIFYFYYSRMKLTTYLEQIQLYIKLNEVEVNNNSKFDVAKKKDIIDKQNKWIERLESLSDKIRVNQSVGQKAAKAGIEKANKEVTIDKVNQDNSSNGGFDFA